MGTALNFNLIISQKQLPPGSLHLTSTEISLAGRKPLTYLAPKKTVLFQTATELLVTNKIAIKRQSSDTKVYENYHYHHYNILHLACIIDMFPPPDFVFKENNTQFFTISINYLVKGVKSKVAKAAADTELFRKD